MIKELSAVVLRLLPIQMIEAANRDRPCRTTTPTPHGPHMRLLLSPRMEALQHSPDRLNHIIRDLANAIVQLARPAPTTPTFPPPAV